MEQYKGLRERAILEQSSVIENAPYLLSENYSIYLSGSSKGSKGNSSSSSHSSGSSSHSASRGTGLESKF